MKDSLDSKVDSLLKQREKLAEASATTFMPRLLGEACIAAIEAGSVINKTSIRVQLERSLMDCASIMKPGYLAAIDLVYRSPD